MSERGETGCFGAMFAGAVIGAFIALTIVLFALVDEVETLRLRVDELYHQHPQPIEDPEKR